jgi:PadR family transcriptional regulator PadR
MRRKPGALLPIEQGILAALAALHRRGVSESHGYEIAQYLRDLSDAKNLTAYGTLYRALARLADMGLLDSRWEAPQAALEEARPVRRLYSLTATGTAAARETRAAPVSIAAGRRAAVRA